MIKVTTKCQETGSKPLIICDFSPPRGADPTLLDGVRSLNTDFVSVAYSPGKSVRVDSLIAAYAIRQHGTENVIFTISTRDMNKLALQNHLLGASVLGLDNVIVLMGDNFTKGDPISVRNVSDFTSSELIETIKYMNQGIDYKGLKLRSPTDFCVGATIDLGKDIHSEAKLAYRKTLAGADFFISQPLYNLTYLKEFQSSYKSLSGEEFHKPLFLGLQVLRTDGLVFGELPANIKHDLDRGRDGTDITIELLHEFITNGITKIYLVPPILRGGLRDYVAAQKVVDASKKI